MLHMVYKAAVTRAIENTFNSPAGLFGRLAAILLGAVASSSENQILRSQTASISFIFLLCHESVRGS